MKRTYNHTECFEFFGTRPHNTYWSWSAKSADGQTVVVTLWQDQLRMQDGKTIYVWKASKTGDVERRPGYKELMTNLQWAKDHCDGKFRVIVAIAKDTKAEPRSIRECFPHPKLTMRLTEFDATEGAFRAESM